MEFHKRFEGDPVQRRHWFTHIALTPRADGSWPPPCTPWSSPSARAASRRSRRAASCTTSWRSPRAKHSPARGW
ncbi:hypothetical protein ACRAWF_23320 [Streptomyces sp. L7]